MEGAEDSMVVGGISADGMAVGPTGMRVAMAAIVGLHGLLNLDQRAEFDEIQNEIIN